MKKKKIKVKKKKLFVFGDAVETNMANIKRFAPKSYSPFNLRIFTTRESIKDFSF